MSGNSSPPVSISINLNVFLSGDARHAAVGGNAVTIAADPDQVFFSTQHLVPRAHTKPFEATARRIPGFHSIERGQFYTDDGEMGNTCVVWAVVRRDAPYILARSMGLSGYQAVRISPAWYDMLEETTRIRNAMGGNPQGDDQDDSDEEQYHLGVHEDEDCTGNEASIAEDDDMRPEEDVRAAGHGHRATDTQTPAAMRDVDRDH
ncbi:uncharacterized protein PAN0_001d0428 [Moesziomyces antarcticus]|uniref:Uncharacterized protein n=1 Tax=Pseudozyma antarctica TaxID=84753 RepID=A0A5C3FGD0_PSEA2|nr:uncharacterized protein PAN0_001d0428 [Moesziomyces antarcticus]GAK62230.1 hypothetical protein PAN0_001d0428 [Moesziomyces antarcticus]SPO42767.1 uncharacterized protein PSANT_00450 [Moesziomyces antarcticus]